MILSEAADPIEPQPIGTKLVQLPLQFCNGPLAPRCCKTGDFIAHARHTSTPRSFRTHPQILINAINARYGKSPRRPFDEG
jgi:hypothetical protein